MKCELDLILRSQFSSVAQSCPTLCDPMNRSTPGLPVHHQLPEFTLTHIHWVGGAIQPSHPLLSPSPPAPNPSQHQSLFQESTIHMRWPKYWSFTLSISASNEHPGLISFRMDWLDLLAVQGTLNCLFQHHSSKHQCFRVNIKNRNFSTSQSGEILQCLGPRVESLEGVLWRSRL